jgi:outer membrane protein OmpA-like peptidoglycan-associated protein
MVSGQLNTDSKLKIENGKLDGSNKLAINNLEIKPANTEKSDKLNAELSMPLDSALSLLRDKNDDIKLDLPLTGDINKPDFDISGVINKALGNALKKSSLAYLTLALQPYGSLIAIANLAKNAANQVNLNPIEFSPGSSALNQTASDYVTKLSTVLTDRPQLRLKLCGYTTQNDKIALSVPVTKTANDATIVKTDVKKNPVSDKDLQVLANTRAEAIKDSLISAHKIEASRLFICKPEIDDKPDAKPRVEITL